MNQRNTIDFDQGWEFIQRGITRIQNILEGKHELPFTSDDYSMLYAIVYNMCTQKPPHDYSEQLYVKYQESFEKYIRSTVLPSLREKHDEFMLRELVQRWSNHKMMVRSISGIFSYLDRYFVARRSIPTLYEVGLICFRDSVYRELNTKVRDAVISLVLPSLREKHDEFMLRELVQRWSNHKMMVRSISGIFSYLDRYFVARRSIPTLYEVGLICFRDSVYRELNTKVRDAVISLIDQEREGAQIDLALLKNVLDIFVELGLGQLDCYENDFETAMLKYTTAYYSRKASSWFLDNSCPDYMLKAEECLKREMDRAAHYLHASSETKLLQALKEAFTGNSIAGLLATLAI